MDTQISYRVISAREFFLRRFCFLNYRLILALFDAMSKFNYFLLLIIFAFLTLSGCSQLEKVNSSKKLLSWEEESSTKSQAEAISAASIKLQISNRSGLAILGASSDDSTFWAFGNNSLVSLYKGGLQATGGLDSNLLTTQYYSHSKEHQTHYVPWQEPVNATYQLERHWITTSGETIAMRASGEMVCDKTQRFDLVLATDIELQQCDATYTWSNGQITQAQWWRTPGTGRVWKAKEQIWPEGPYAEWEVARPWWSQ